MNECRYYYLWLQSCKIQWILTNLFETCVYSFPEMLALLHLKICRDLVTVDQNLRAGYGYYSTGAPSPDTCACAPVRDPA